MGIWPDLRNEAETIIKEMQAVGGSPSRDAVKKAYLDAVAMNPDALNIVSWNGIWAGRFAKVIDEHREELRPWILVNPAATGALGPFAAVINVWCRVDLPDPLTKLAPAVEELLDSLFEGYIRAISIEEIEKEE